MSTNLGEAVCLAIVLILNLVAMFLNKWTCKSGSQLIYETECQDIYEYRVTLGLLATASILVLIALIVHIVDAALDMEHVRTGCRVITAVAAIVEAVEIFYAYQNFHPTIWNPTIYGFSAGLATAVAISQLGLFYLWNE